MNAISTLLNLTAELFFLITRHATCCLWQAPYVFACLLHTIVPWPLVRRCWSQFAARWGDCKRSRIASSNVIIIVIIFTISISLLLFVWSRQSRCLTNWPIHMRAPWPHTRLDRDFSLGSMLPRNHLLGWKLSGSGNSSGFRNIPNRLACTWLCRQSAERYHSKLSSILKFDTGYARAILDMRMSRFRTTAKRFNKDYFHWRFPCNDRYL